MTGPVPATPGRGGPGGHGTDDGGLDTPFGRAATTMTVSVLLLWTIELVNGAMEHEWSASLGIRARRPESLPDIVTAPFLHGSAEHVAGNCTALFGLGLVAALAGIRRFLAVTVTIVLISGFGVWLASPERAVTFGASGVVFGYLGYLLMRGLVDRRPVDIVVSIGVAIAYGYFLSGVLPGDPGVSWQGHLAGLIAGGFAAWLFRRRRPRGRPVDPGGSTSPLPSNPPSGPTPADG